MRESLGAVCGVPRVKARKQSERVRHHWLVPKGCQRARACCTHLPLFFAGGTDTSTSCQSHWPASAQEWGRHENWLSGNSEFICAGDVEAIQLENSREFLAWQPGDKAPSTELEVIIAFGKVDSREIEAQTKLGLLQMASAGYEGVDVEAATKFGVWVGSAPTTKTGNGESVRIGSVAPMTAGRCQSEQDSAACSRLESSR
jgi:hypothetical protein